MSNTSFEDDERFDGLYLNVAQTARGIDPLLDTVFGFLRRKTDFFAGPPGSDNGPEAAMQKVKEVMEKHSQRYQKEHNLKPSSSSTTTSTKSTSKKTTNSPIKKPKNKATAPPNAAATAAAAAAEDVIEMGRDGGFDVSTAAAAAASAAAVATPVASDSKPAPAVAAADSSTPIDANKEESLPPTTDATSQGKDNDDADTSAVPPPPPPAGNGGTVPGKYVWTQTLAEVLVTIPVPENTRGRDLTVTMTKTKLKVGLRGRGEDAAIVIVADGSLMCKPIIVDDSFWTVEDGNRLVLNLQKLNDMEWWDCVVQGDPTVDVKTIQPESSNLGDLDGETRKTVEKMMFDQRQKAMGLPTSEEQTKFDAIERFKVSHPELDFSNAKIS